MTAQPPRTAGAGRRRGAGTPVLAVLAVLIPVLLMAVLTARIVLARTSCEVHPVLLNVAVTADLAPAVDQVARLYNRQQHQAGGRCAQVQVTEADPAAVAGVLDGQHPRPGLPAAGAWIPDSSLWVAVARRFPAGAQAIRTAGITVARSPLLLAMPAAAAARTPEFGAAVNWRFLLPASAGGPPADVGLRVELPDPADSSVGLAALIQISRALGASAQARTALAEFILTSRFTTALNNQAALASFASLAAPPLRQNPVTITTEQAVIAYDRAHPAVPLTARYPAGADRLLGTPELDYPYVLTTADPQLAQVARQFGQALRGSYATSVIRYHGFRSARGTPDTLPAGDGLRGQLLTVAEPATAGQAQATLETWDKARLGSNDLTIVDTSAAMGKPSGIPGWSSETEAAATANLGLELFSASTRMGLWQFSYRLSGQQPYRQLVPIGPLAAPVGLISRRQQLEQADKTLRASPSAPAALHDTILASYEKLLHDYQPGDANTLIVLTSGVDDAPGDMSLGRLLSRLRALYNPNKRVEIVALQFGTAGDYPALKQIAGITGGLAYLIRSPQQVTRAFFGGVGNRTCDPSCSG